MKEGDTLDSKWSEIRNDFYDDEGKCITIDAWITGSDDEEGRIIARVFDDGKIEYVDEDAKTDPYAQEKIKEALIDMLMKIGSNTELLAGNDVAGHTKYLQNIFIPIYVNSIGKPDGTLLPSEVAEMHIGKTESGETALFITPEVISI